MDNNSVEPEQPVQPIQQRATVPVLAHTINLLAIPLALMTVILVLADVDSSVRVWFTVLLFLFGPGSGLTQFLKLPDAALQFGVVISLSLAIDLLLGQALLSAHNMSGEAAVCVLAGITCIRPSFRGKTINEATS